MNRLTYAAELAPAAGVGSLLALSALAVAAVLLLTFAIALQIGKHAIIDVIWGLGFATVAIVGFVVTGDAGGDPTRRLLALVLTVVWGARLAIHIARRTIGSGEDPRYEALLARGEGNPAAYALLHIYLPQGVIMWFVSLPVQVSMVLADRMNVIGWIGVVVWAVGIVFEAVGDWQLSKFRADPASKGTVLDTGLWRYTRHPNYFGDACVWWGLYLVAASAWPGPLTFLSPILMSWFLVKGTGKALLEKDIGDRRPGYAEYVRKTSGFIPWPPKSGA